MESQVLKIFLALVVLVNPFAALSLFIDITKDANRQQTRKVALISAITVFVTIAIFSLAGEPILKVLGFRLGSISYRRRYLGIDYCHWHDEWRWQCCQTACRQIGGFKWRGVSRAASAVVPLTIPMVIGPGGISTVIIYAASGHSYFNMLAIITAGLIISIITYLSFMAAGR